MSASWMQGKCVACANFKPGNHIPLHGYCVGNVAAYKEMTKKSFTKGAPEGPSFLVHKLDGCSFWQEAK